MSEITERNPLGEMLEKTTKKFGKKPAIIFEGKEIGYNEFNQNANKIGNALKRLGISKGDRVAIMLPNIPEFLYSFLGIQRIGAVAVTINPMYKGGEITHILSDSDAKAIITLTNFVTLINEIKPELPSLEHIIVTGERTVIFTNPESTIFVQMVFDRGYFPDIDDAYKKVGEVLVRAFKGLGVEDVWYKHLGGLRVKGKKIAGFTFGEIEDVFIVNIICFISKLETEEFFKVIWVPPEVKDKTLEPLISVEEITGKRPSNEEFRDAVLASFKDVMGIETKEGPLGRDELFGYEKIRSIAYKK